jgi:hypothetical protein
VTDRFRVELKGDVTALKAVAPYLQTPELRLEVDGDTIYLKSMTLEALTWPDDVIAAARRMVPSIKAAIRLAGVTGLRAVNAYRVVVQTPEGPRNFVYVYAQEAVGVGEALSATVLGGSQPPPAPIPIEIALTDARVALALELFAHDPNWYDFYKVLDVVEEDVGGERALEAKGWFPRSELKRFTQTANSHGAVGLEARHARDAFRPPKVPMPLADSVDLIRRVLISWLATKGVSGQGPPGAP